MDASKLFVPDKGKDHTDIAAKAYLSRKDIRELVVPNSIDSIGDWAFAFMKNLEVLWIPKKEIRLGRDILKECEKLQDIFCYEKVHEDQDFQMKETESEGVNIRFSSESTPESRLFASVVMKLGVTDFLTPEEMGSDTWFHKLDKHLLNWIREDDQKGFAPSWFGGEEDYLEDSSNSKAAYQKEQERKKIEVVFERLDCDQYLEEKSKEQYVDYLTTRMKEEEEPGQNAVWSFLLAHADYPAYCRFILQTGQISRTQIQAVIELLNGENPELIAMLLSYATEERQEIVGIFDDFTL